MRALCRQRWCEASQSCRGTHQRGGSWSEPGPALERLLRLSGAVRSLLLVTWLSKFDFLAAATIRDAPWGHRNGLALCVSAHQSFGGSFLADFYLGGTFVVPLFALKLIYPLLFFPPWLCFWGPSLLLKSAREMFWLFKLPKLYWFLYIFFFS